MATRKRRSKTTTTAAPRRSYYPRRRSGGRRKSSGVNDIPKAGATIGLAAANIPVMQTVANDLSVNGVKTAAQQAIQPDQLKKDAVYAGVGFGVGYLVKNFAPKIIKKPAAEVAKMVKRVF